MLSKSGLNFESTSLKSLFSDSIIYGLSSAVNRLTVLLILPLYAKKLPPDIFVNINLTSNLFMLVNVILFFGLDNAIAISYYNQENIERRKEIFASWFWFEFAVNIAVFVLFVITAGYISEKLIHSNHDKIIVLAAISQLFSFPLYILAFWYRLKRKPILNLFVVSINGLILLLVNAFFLYFSFKGIEGYFIAQSISSIIVSLIAIILLKEWILPSYFKLTLIYSKVKDSFGMLLANLSAWFVAFSSIYFIQFLVSDKALAGIYQIALLINTFVSFIVNAFAQALGPYAQSIKKDRVMAMTKYQNVFKLYILIVGFLTMTVSIYSKELVLIVSNHDYLLARDVVFLICFSTFFNGLSYIGGIGFVVGDKVNLNRFGVLSSLGTLLNILLFLIFIPIFGIYGAAIASFFSSVIQCITIFYYSKSFFHIRFNYKLGLCFIILIFLISLLTVNIDRTDSIGFNPIFYKFIIVSSMAIVVIKLKKRVF